MIMYNDLPVNGDRSNDRLATRYPTPHSPMESLIPTCPPFDMSHSPALQDSPALPSYRVQFGPELSTLMDENERHARTLASSTMAESYSHFSAHDPTASFPLSLLDAGLFSEDAYASTFGPMLVPHPSSELSWTPRHVGNRESNDHANTHGLCLSPYALQHDTSYGMTARQNAHTYLGRESFETVTGESTSSSETDSLPRTPENVAPSVAFGQFGGLMEPSPSQKGSLSWDHSSLSSSARSSFNIDDSPDSIWKVSIGGMKGDSRSIRPSDLASLSTSRSSTSSSSIGTKRKQGSVSSSPRTPQPARLNRSLLDKLPPGMPYQEVEAARSRCNECKRTFQRPEHLTRHKKSGAHAGDYAPFVCELPRCVDKQGNRKRFNRQDNKTAHIVKTHLTPAAKGRRDRVEEWEARALGWEKHFEAAAKESAKQAKITCDSGRPIFSTPPSRGVQSGRVAKKTSSARRAQKSPR